MDPKQLEAHFAKLSDQELLNAYARPDDYLHPAWEILTQEIERRGGANTIDDRISHQEILQTQRQILRERIKSSLLKGEPITWLELTQDLHAMDSAEFGTIQLEEEAKFLHDQAQQKVSGKSIGLGIVGAVLGAAIGGPILGFSMMGSRSIIGIVLFGLAVISYGCVRLFSGKSARNIGTLLLSVFSFVAALLIGFAIFEYYGPEAYLP